VQNQSETPVLSQILNGNLNVVPVYKVAWLLFSASTIQLADVIRMPLM